MNKVFTKTFRSILLAAAVAVAGTLSATPELVPLFEFHTAIYDQIGETNEFSLGLDVSETMDVYVDAGSGVSPVPRTLEPAENSESGAINLLYLTAGQSGTITIYGEKEEDARKIEYLDASGTYLTHIDLGKLTNLDVLNLSHNQILDLDLSKNTKIRALYLSDNPFAQETPLVIGDKPELVILELQIIDYLSPDFDLTKYPKLQSFDAYHCPTLTRIDPTNCPNLLQLTLEMTNVSSVDVSKNTQLVILNVSESAVRTLDLSKNTKLQQLYCEHVSGTYNTDAKMESLDVTACPELIRLICSGNRLTSLDLSNNKMLITLSCRDNYLTSLDLSAQYQLQQVYIDRNCLDFATLPINPGTWEDYSYQQRPIPTARSYKEGDVLDLSQRILREGTNTTLDLRVAVLVNPDSLVQLDDSYYTYEEGKITFLKAHSDSLYLTFSNSLFTDYGLWTEKFMVKTEEEFGKPTHVLSFMPSVEKTSYQIGIAGATIDNPKTFFVEYRNYADGSIVRLEQTTTGATLADATLQTIDIPAYTTLDILMPEGNNISAIGMPNLGLYDISLDKLIGLQQLNLQGNNLSNVDLEYNRYLESLNLSHNQIRGHFSLVGINDLFDKNVLNDIDISNNAINEITLSPRLAIRNLNLSNNQLEQIDLADADSVLTIDLSNNQIEQLELTHCSRLHTINVAHNNLSTIVLPTENHVEKLSLHHNYFTLATLPLHGNISEQNYLYAPQADLVIATKGPCTDLGSQYLTINDKTTTYQWIKEDGSALVEGQDYTIKDGFTRFINTEVGKVYCAISHHAFPAFEGEDILKSTKIEVAGMPTNEIASFVTKQDNDTVRLSLAADKEGTAVYIDWEGNDNVIQYVLGTTYRLFEAVTLADKNVRVYTYEPTEQITVFSMNGATLSAFDGSKLKHTRTLTIQNAGLSAITLPEEKNIMTELNLSGNMFTAVDFASYPNLVSLSLNNNQFTAIDLSVCKNLQLASMANNQLTSVGLDNPNLWLLDLSVNALKDIDLTKVPNLEQLSLSHNALTKIDLSALPRLNALLLDFNYFNLQTLPLPQAQYILYNYANQAAIPAQITDGYIVDLSSQASLNDEATTYSWYLGVPEWNPEMGVFEGVQLEEGVDYTIEKGVTTFLRSFEDAMCIMHNAIFPNLYLYTDLLTLSTDLVETSQTGISIEIHERTILLTIEDEATVSLYTIAGQCLTTMNAQAGTNTLTAPTAGAYLLCVDNQTYKVLLH